MQRVLVCLIAVLLAAFLPAQARQACVQLDDGEVINGAVLAMDLSTLRIQVGHDVRTIEATRIRSCRFVGQDPPAGEPAEAGATQEPRAQEPAAQPPAATPSEAGQPEPGKEGAANAPPKVWQRPPDPIDTTAELPHDLRHRSRFRQRLEALDDQYPWLAPAAPSQWVSLGLLLAISLTLIVHLSVRVAGGESPLGRAAAVTAWYLLSALLQVAAVPVNDFSICLMLLANATLALFWLRGLFGLSRGASMIAFAVQLGFFVLVFGVLELVGSLLGSINVPGA